jgi:hypothetical protein
MFNQVELFLNQTLVSSTGVNYAYKAMIDTLLTTTNETIESSLQAEGFFKDFPTYMDADDPILGPNDGLTNRFVMTNSSKRTEFRGPLHLDVGDQDRYIINGVETKLTLWPSKDTFRLMAHADDADFKVQIVDAVLHVCKITINPTITTAHNEALQISPALYPYERSQIKTFEVSSGKSSFDIENIFLGEVPRLLIVAMVDSDAYRGTYHKNPYNFKHNDLSWISVKLDDEDVPFQAVKTKFTDEAPLYMQSYMNLLDAKSSSKDGWIVDRRSFRYGYSLFVYELLPRDDIDHLPLIRKGNLKVQATFGANLGENITVICYGKFPAVMKIDSSRDIIV